MILSSGQMLARVGLGMKQSFSIGLARFLIRDLCPYFSLYATTNATFLIDPIKVDLQMQQVIITLQHDIDACIKNSQELQRGSLVRLLTSYRRVFCKGRSCLFHESFFLYATNWSEPYLILTSSIYGFLFSVMYKLYRQSVAFAYLR